MVVYYSKSFNHEDLIKEEIKGEKFRVFKESDFKDYVKQVKDEKEVKVIFNTVLHRVNPKNMEDDKNYIFINKLCFELKEEKNKKGKYYIPVSDTEFVRVETSFPIIILLLLLLGAIVVGGTIYLTKNPPTKPVDPITMDEQQKEGEGQQIQTNSEFYQESTVVQGYAEVQATSKAALIPLTNPEENTVNFIYTILLTKDSQVVKTFDDMTAAYEYVRENKFDYKNVKDGNDYKLEDQNGNLTTEFVEYKPITNESGKVDVFRNTYDLIYFSDGIAPGNHVDWNCYEYLGVGTFDLQFRISTFDVVTSEQCYGAIQPVHIEISE